MLFLTSILYRHFSDFGANLAPTWLPTWVQNRPQTTKNSIKKRIKMLINFSIEFSWLLKGFFVDLASMLEGPGPQNIWKTEGFLKILLFQPSCQQEAIWSVSGPTWPPTWPPKTSRIRPKMVAKPIQNQVKNKSKFDINFKLHFYRFLSILTPKSTPKMRHFCGFFGDFLGLAGSWGQDGPQTPPKRASKTDFGAILVVKMAPRSPQESPRSPKRPPRDPHFQWFC